MGVGKTSVARHLAELLQCSRQDLDILIEKEFQCSVAELIDTRGETEYRRIESDMLRQTVEHSAATILSLGGGTWARAENREVIRGAGLTAVWLESTFDHCWKNIRASKKERPLARSKDSAMRLFEERQNTYCLADWHFVIRPGQSSYDVALHIAEEIFS